VIRPRLIGWALLLACMVASAAEDPIDAAIASERMPKDRAEDASRKPGEVLRFLEIAPDQRVLDFFGGPGYYSELMARIVGPQGQVLLYNNELYYQTAYHDLMMRMARKRLPNVKALREPSNYLQLEPNSVDRVLFSLVYHDLYWRPQGSPDTMGEPTKVLANLHKAVKPGGLVVVVDHVANDTGRDGVVAVASRLHRIDPKIVIEDFTRAGFEYVGASEALSNANDDRSASVFNPRVRGQTDRFIYKFRRP
jgi:predicted methyltransferase